MRVLVIDDDEIQLRAASGLLRQNGFDVTSALSPEQAYAKLASEPFDAALVDLMMPRTNGLELIRGLRAKAPWLRVVLTSSFPMAHGQLERLGIEDVSFVPKPVTIDALRAVLGAVEPPRTDHRAPHRSPVPR